MNDWEKTESEREELEEEGRLYIQTQTNTTTTMAAATAAVAIPTLWYDRNSLTDCSSVFYFATAPILRGKATTHKARRQQTGARRQRKYTVKAADTCAEF